MRSEHVMFQTILDFAKNDERIRIVSMEGSRTNINVPKDDFQDYDISFLVTEMGSFKESDQWLEIFGKRVMMQKPEAMDLFPPTLGNWFSYLMLFDDGTKMDLKLIPLNELDGYLSKDKLIKILLDKDGRIQKLPVPSDEDYWIKKPSAAYFDDCCNEFWFVSTYIAKGLCRNEILFSAYHMEAIARKQLLTMLSWNVGTENDFNFSVGKNCKYIRKYLSDKQWNLLMKTYRMDNLDDSWDALYSAHKLFRLASSNVAEKLGFPYPNYDANITKYIAEIAPADCTAPL